MDDVLQAQGRRKRDRKMKRPKTKNTPTLFGVGALTLARLRPQAREKGRVRPGRICSPFDAVAAASAAGGQHGGEVPTNANTSTKTASAPGYTGIMIGGRVLLCLPLRRAWRCSICPSCRPGTLWTVPYPLGLPCPVSAFRKPHRNRIYESGGDRTCH